MSIPSFRPGQYPGVGQGLPTNRFAQPPRQPSNNALQSPGQFARPSQATFPFGAASQPLPPAGLTAAQEANLDPSDFPALGGAPATPSAGTATSNLPSSYASQIGTAANAALGGSTTGAGQGQGQGQGQGVANGQLPPGPAREFSADDFPALGGFPSNAPPGSQPSIGSQPGGPQSQQQQQQQQAGATASSDNAPGANALTNGINGLSLLPNAARNLSGSNEQASAAAALQHQQQHRANLLGAMNGGASRTPSQAEADKRQFALKQAAAATGAQQQPWASSQYANGVGGAASSPLPPNNNNPSDQSLRSPSLGSAAAPPPGVSSLLSSSQARGAIGSTGGAASAPLPPPPSSTSSGVAGSQVPQTPAQQVLFSPADRYGLLGLLHIIKTSDPDLNMLALGNDLTTLGLDLSASDNLYSTFITPWSDAKAASALNIEPEFHLPSCYNVQPPPAQTKIGNFSDETLFFIFYSQPRDTMQEMASHELYKHNWRYHKELKLWLTKEAGTEPTQKTATYERGSYIIFDPTAWERVRREFVLEFAALESRRA